MENEKIAVSVLDLSKQFGKEKILKNITQNFEDGKIHGLVGFNGSGKTVLLKCICGFLKPSRGKIYVYGKEIGKDVDFPEDLGLLIENPGFLGNYSGMKNLKMLADLRKKISKEDIKRVITSVGLDWKNKKPVSKYSMGMRQRLAIAQAIMENPKLLILDEPFNGLDKSMAEKIRILIKGLRVEGRTIFLVSHNIVDIESLCDTVFEMDAGKIKQVR